MGWAFDKMVWAFRRVDDRVADHNFGRVVDDAEDCSGYADDIEGYVVGAECSDHSVVGGGPGGRPGGGPGDSCLACTTVEGSEQYPIVLEKADW